MSDQFQQETPLAERAAASFASMSEKVKTNAENGFSGAVVIFPPEGEPIEMLICDNKQSAAMLWSNVQTLAKMALDELDDAQRKKQTGWGR